MTSPHPRLIVLSSSLLFAALLAGCSGTAHTPATLAPTAAQAADLPPGAEDVWELGLSGNLIQDMGEYMDIERLTGGDEVFTATQVAANQMTDVCLADTDRIAPGLESDLERNVRMLMDSEQNTNGTMLVRVLASYGCPEDWAQVNAAINKAA